MKRFATTRPVIALSLGVVPASVLLCGCNRDARLAGHNVRRDLAVREVAHYGVRLDPEASPRQVAFVLLRAIRDDVLAATAQERSAALDVQFDLAAVNVIKARNPMSLSDDEFLFHVVYRWAPAVSYYVGSFALEWENAGERFLLHGPRLLEEAGSGAMQSAVALEVDDPLDPNGGAVLVVWLAQDEGFWRVVRVGFDPSRRSFADAAGVASPG